MNKPHQFCLKLRLHPDGLCDYRLYGGPRGLGQDSQPPLISKEKWLEPDAVFKLLADAVAEASGESG